MPLPPPDPSMVDEIRKYKLISNANKESCQVEKQDKMDSVDNARAAADAVKYDDISFGIKAWYEEIPLSDQQLLGQCPGQRHYRCPALSPTVAGFVLKGFLLVPMSLSPMFSTKDTD